MTSGKKSKQKRKKEKEELMVKYGEEVELKNGHFDSFSEMSMFPGALSLRKLRKERLNIDLRKALFELWIQIINSTQATAYSELREQLVKEFDEKQKKKKKEERLPATLQNVEGINELLDKPSGLKVKKLQIPMKLLSEAISVEDMVVTAWLFDYV